MSIFWYNCFMDSYASETIKLYGKDGWKKWFAYWRFWAAPYILVEKMIPPKGVVVELGCGEGLFSNFVAQHSSDRKVIGIELDKERVSIAHKGLKNTKFKAANAVTSTLPSSDCIVMFHLLHHLKGQDDQDLIIKNAAKSLRKGGKIIIVEIDKDNSLKYYFTSFWDHFVVAWVFEKHLYQPDIHFRSQEGWKKLFKSLKLKVNTTKYHRGMPFNHIIYELSSF